MSWQDFVPKQLFECFSIKSVVSGFAIKVEVRDTNTPVGYGVFALESAERNSLIWEKKTVVELNKAGYEAFAPKLDNAAKSFFWSHVYSDVPTSDYYLDDHHAVILTFDEGMFVNHSADPNIRGGEQKENLTACYAAKKINIGDQICDNYGKYYNPEWYVKYCKEFGIMTSRQVSVRFP